MEQFRKNRMNCLPVILILALFLTACDVILPITTQTPSAAPTATEATPSAQETTAPSPTELPNVETTAPTETPTETPTAPAATESTPGVCAHSYEETLLAATCTAEGSKIRTCRLCGDSTSEILPMIAHSYCEATCTEPSTCTACGQTRGAPLGHIWKFSSCNALEKCSRCNHFGGEFVQHQWDSLHLCPVCNSALCSVYEHRYFYNRCHYCSVFDSEVTAFAEVWLPQIIQPGMSEYQKVKAIHDHIASTTQYDYTNYTNGTIPDSSYSPMGVLLHGTAVCQGYAYAFELFCDLANIDCVTVTGTSKGIAHGWNQVKIDGKWYNVDITWDDPVIFTNGVRTHVITYDYFLISDSVFYRDHNADNAMYVCSESYPQ